MNIILAPGLVLGGEGGGAGGREEEGEREAWEGDGKGGRVREGGMEGGRGREEGETNISAIKLCSLCCLSSSWPTLSSQLRSTLHSNDQNFQPQPLP